MPEFCDKIAKSPPASARFIFTFCTKESCPCEREHSYWQRAKLAQFTPVSATITRSSNALKSTCAKLSTPYCTCCQRHCAHRHRSRHRCPPTRRRRAQSCCARYAHFARCAPMSLRECTSSSSPVQTAKNAIALSAAFKIAPLSSFPA